MKRVLISLAFALAAIAPAAAHADDNSNWVKPIKPYRVVGNIYYVGSEGLSAWLITSSEGHVLLDSGPSADGAKLIERSIQQLGFQLADVKILINTHAHFDHAGGLAQLKADTGAKVWASRLDEPALEQGHHIGDNSNGPTPFPAVKVDKSFGDGQKLKLGETALVAHLTPGHTLGCTTWTMAVVEKSRPLNVTFPCSLSVAGNVLVGNKGHRSIVADYRSSFVKLRAIPTDVMLPSHEEQGDLLAKRQKLLRGDPNAFIDPTELARFVDGYETRFNQELARQQAASPGGAKR
ncbi:MULTISPECIES: CAU/MBL1b family subclass B3 metallo-beta-lactamase [unclassified Caulobacter]|uniref:CAU/MBL1b family subclass B3 metallo-beta-lactamase n=1 Tax=unclassified Caulobacter TaxID=2648921 RepID=UPI0006FD11DA|nr:MULTISPECIES: CAU/MBL1b family subclass B3 metallo-beta-lactamase [unclassified Caulobacter]KQV58342.1 subclass B3 metallo-beta-lactamase [Caulobacter sp. Root342]KQV69151.1 subclass B3 metallo-beta-lactamase [Caulobacter sp. Root343]